NGPGALINQGALTLSNDTVNTTLVNQAALLVQGNGAVNGPLTAAAGSTLRVQGGSCFDSALTVAAGFTNQGTIELTNANSCSTSASLNVASGTLTNAAGGTISALVGTGGGVRNLIAQLDNQGTINVSGGVTLPLTGALT